MGVNQSGSGPCLQLWKEQTKVRGINFKFVRIFRTKIISHHILFCQSILRAPLNLTIYVVLTAEYPYRSFVSPTTASAVKLCE